MTPVAYEQLLSQHFDLALREGSMHFEHRSAVHAALRKIVKRLTDERIPYAIAGGMALFFHGVRRFTEDVHILVTRDGLAEIHKTLEGLGYLPLFAGSQGLRDAELGVRVEFIVTGEYPGDGKPKPVAFPDPDSAAIEQDGVRWLTLPKLIELKLASGMTNPGRLRDLADVQELIRTLRLPADYAQQLSPYVQEKYRELHHSVASAP